MAIIKCHECKREISDEAEACPQCGAKPKKSVGVLGIVAAGIIGLAVFQCTSRTEEAAAKQRASEAAKSPEQKRIEELARELDAGRAKMARAAIKELKRQLKDPESLKVEVLGVRPDGGIACVLYRAKNSFNATIPGVFAFNGTQGSSEARSVKKLCGDMTDFVSYAHLGK